MPSDSHACCFDANVCVNHSHDLHVFTLTVRSLLYCVTTCKAIVRYQGESCDLRANCGTTIVSDRKLESVDAFAPAGSIGAASVYKQASRLANGDRSILAGQVAEHPLAYVYLDLR